VLQRHAATSLWRKCHCQIDCGLKEAAAEHVQVRKLKKSDLSLKLCFFNPEAITGDAHDPCVGCCTEHHKNNPLLPVLCADSNVSESSFLSSCICTEPMLHTDGNVEARSSPAQMHVLDAAQNPTRTFFRLQCFVQTAMCQKVLSFQAAPAWNQCFTQMAMLRHVPPAQMHALDAAQSPTRTFFR